MSRKPELLALLAGLIKAIAKQVMHQHQNKFTHF